MTRWAAGGYDDTNPSDVERANAELEDDGRWVRCSDCGDEHFLERDDCDPGTLFQLQREREAEEVSPMSDEEIEWLRESFPTEAEARAFEQGLTYGDEPEWVVDEVVPCRHNPSHWDVAFARADP